MGPIARSLDEGRFGDASAQLGVLFAAMLADLSSREPARARRAYDFFLVVCGRFDEFFPAETFTLLQRLDDGLFDGIACDATNTF